MIPREKIVMITNWIEGQYDPENDIVYDAPVVTFIDEKLMRCIRQLLIMVEDLETQVFELKAGIK